jgi:hypothetical protein
MVLIPEPTFGPGDLHLNRTSRKVNNGFEILPAGTFGALHDLGTAQDLVQANEPYENPRPNTARTRKKLRKSLTAQQEEEFACGQVE